MLRTSAVLFSTFLAFAQEAPPSGGQVGATRYTAEAPPTEVDTALRNRVNQFYQAHVDGKFRVADQVVAEDSKDFFFAAPKPRYEGFEIVRINYLPGFKQADAIVGVKSTWNVRGAKMPITTPITTNWKIIDGQWFWFVEPVKDVATPFGSMRYDQQSKAPATALPADPNVLAERILAGVRVDKNDLRLSSYEPSTAEVKVQNGLQGPISIRVVLDGAFPGLSYTIGQPTIEGGKESVIKFKCEPRDKAAKPTLTARIYVDPTNQILPVTLTFSIPPEIERQIPKEAMAPKPKP